MVTFLEFETYVNLGLCASLFVHCGFQLLRIQNSCQ